MFRFKVWLTVRLQDHKDQVDTFVDYLEIDSAMVDIVRCKAADQVRWMVERLDTVLGKDLKV